MTYLANSLPKEEPKSKRQQQSAQKILVNQNIAFLCQNVAALLALGD